MRTLLIADESDETTRVARGLRRYGSVTTAGLAGPLNGDGPLIDLSRPSTLACLDSYDCVVLLAQPAPSDFRVLVEQCAARPLVAVLAITSQEGLERSLLLRRQRKAAWAGSVLLGAGLSPGLTSLAAATLVSPKVDRLEVAIRRDVGTPPVSELGPWAVPSGGARYEAGERIEIAKTDLRTRLPFADGEEHCAIVAGPEAIGLHWSCGAPSTATFVANGRALEGGMLTQWRERLRTEWPGRLPGRLRRLWLRIADSIASRGLGGATEILAIADRQGSDRCIGRWLSLRLEPARLAEAAVFVAFVALLEEVRTPGIFLAEELFTLSDVLGKLDRVAHGQVSVEQVGVEIAAGESEAIRQSEAITVRERSKAEPPARAGAGSQ